MNSRSSESISIERLYGLHAVREALRANRREITRLVLAADKTDRRLRGLRELALSQGLTVTSATPAELGALAGRASHQGAVLEAGPLPVEPFDDIDPTGGAEAHPPFVLVLDGIVDPQNLGALLRSALAAGVSAVVLPKDRSASPTPAVAKASAGAVEHIRLLRATNLARALGRLRNQAVWIYGLDAGEGRDLFRWDLTGPLALVVGGEARGIRPLVRRHCDALLTIPQAGPVASLNASAAGAVALFEVVRQRRRMEMTND